ncbi:hypothetical protein [Aeromicrobium sp. Leaf350]|uniref:hypothetical protein n=1 Tax=Aeromicrobium sp. Leaf350 TaxID=2876565 RepID=UPI001E3D9B27|nr:hypothetical protein [Aeromicrobium sp. Leaf350]
MTSDLQSLADALVVLDAITTAEVDDGFVVATGRLAATGEELTLNVDPELEDLEAGEDVDLDALVGTTERLLELGSDRWQAIRDEVASEIEEAVGDEAVAEPTDLRDDLTLVSSAVFADAVLLAFAAPRQFPESQVLVQLDEDHTVDDVQVQPVDGLGDGES